MESAVRNVGVIVGSLRKASFSRRLAIALQSLAPASLRLGIIEIGAMSLYNQDDEPKGSSVYDYKPAAVISLSPGALGAFGANHHLRQCLMCLNVATMPAPEAYVGARTSSSTSAGRSSWTRTRQFLEQFMPRFAEWIERNGRFAAARS